MTNFLSFQTLCQILVNGVLFGTMYGIAAIGMSLIFGTMQIIFIAQGAMIIFAAYISFWLYTLLFVDPFLSILFVVPAFLILGGGLYQVLFRKVAYVGKNPSLLIAFGFMVLLENLMSTLWTPNTRAINTSYTAFGITALGLQISFTRLVAFVIAVVATIGVTLFLKKTLIGKAVRAASEDLGAAALMGIGIHWVNSITFAIGIGLAALAGITTATTYPFDPYFGFIFSLKALIAVAIGGIGSVEGALFGGILLGVIESLGFYFLSGVWADAISYVVFLLVLMLRPEGLFPRFTRLA
jgi:branched-chain amino acid transport system permease protein